MSATGDGSALLFVASGPSVALGGVPDMSTPGDSTVWLGEGEPSAGGGGGGSGVRCASGGHRAGSATGRLVAVAGGASGQDTCVGASR